MLESLLLSWWISSGWINSPMPLALSCFGRVLGQWSGHLFLVNKTSNVAFQFSDIYIPVVILYDGKDGKFPFVTFSVFVNLDASTHIQICISFFTGYVYDKTLNYNNTFFLMGVIVAVSGLMLYPIPFIQNYQRRKQGGEITVYEMDMGKKPVGDGAHSGHVPLPDEEEGDVKVKC